MIGTAFSLLIGLMALSLPVAAALGLMGYILSQKYAFFPLTGALGELAWNTSNDFILIAAPMFIMMGELMHRSGMSERLFSAVESFHGALTLFDADNRLIMCNSASRQLFAAAVPGSRAFAHTRGRTCRNDPALGSCGRRRSDEAA